MSVCGIVVVFLPIVSNINSSTWSVVITLGNVFDTVDPPALLVMVAPDGKNEI